MNSLMGWLQSLMHQLLMLLLPTSFKVSWGNWSLKRLEHGILISKILPGEPQFSDGTPFSVQEMKRRLGEEE